MANEGTEIETDEILKRKITQTITQGHIFNLSKKIEKKSLIVLLGVTRSGKSTLANYLLGATLESVERDIFGYRLQCRNEGNISSTIGPMIGEGPTSKTSEPGFYAVKNFGDNNTLLVDMPGFWDTRGITQDIINTGYINQIRHASNLKFVLVCSIEDVANDNISNFIDFLAKVKILIPNYESYINSFCVIFTKDNSKSIPGDIATILEKKILNVNEWRMDKALITNFVRNSQLIGLFKMPTKIGEVEAKELDVNIIDAIKECTPVGTENCKIEFSVSDKTEKFFLRVFPQYTNLEFFTQHIKNFTKFSRDFDNYLKIADYVFASFDEELEKVSKQLSLFRSVLSAAANTETTRLQNLHDTLKNIYMRLSDNLLFSEVWKEYSLDFSFVICLEEAHLLEAERKREIIVSYRNSIKTILDDLITPLIVKIEMEQQHRKEKRIGFDKTLCLGGSALTGAVVAAAPRICSFAETLMESTMASSTSVAISPVGRLMETLGESSVGTTASVAGSVAVIGGGIVATAAVTYLAIEAIEIRNAQKRRLEVRARQHRPLKPDV